MRYWKSSAEMKSPRYFFLLIIFLGLTVSPLVYSRNPEVFIEYINANIKDSSLNVDTQIDYYLGAEIQKALEHGVPLEIDTTLRVIRDRPWIWNEMIISKTMTFKIKHRPLSGHYIISTDNDEDLYQFKNLEDGLHWIGNIKNYYLVRMDALNPQQHYRLQVKSALNIKALPAPLRPLAYISTAWHLRSDWTSMDIKP